MSNKNESALERLKQGDIRYADQLAMLAGGYGGMKLNTVAVNSLLETLAERKNARRDNFLKGREVSDLTDAEFNEYIKERDNVRLLKKVKAEYKKRDPSLKIHLKPHTIQESAKKIVDMYLPKERLSKEYLDPLRKKLEERASKGANYHPETHSIRNPATMAEEEILRHEAGHARKGLAKTVLHSSLVRKGLPLAGAVPTIMSFKSADRGYKNKSSDDYRKARNELGLAGALITGPTLVDEARASFNALKDMPGRRMKAFKEILGPAYATYASTLATPFIAGTAALEYYRRKNAKSGI